MEESPFTIMVSPARTLREWYAGIIMAGFAADPASAAAKCLHPEPSKEIAIVADLAVQWADAMIARLQKT